MNSKLRTMGDWWSLILRFIHHLRSMLSKNKIAEGIVMATRLIYPLSRYVRLILSNSPKDINPKILLDRVYAFIKPKTKENENEILSIAIPKPGSLEILCPTKWKSNFHILFQTRSLYSLHSTLSFSQNQRLKFLFKKLFSPFIQIRPKSTKFSIIFNSLIS